MNWLDPLCQTLDEASTPLNFFFRNDDVGWQDQRLYQLLDIFAEQGIHIDLAVIPQALHHSLALELLARRSTGLLGLHQHGYCHTNHESTGRKYEFGPSRSQTQQREDLTAGRARLQNLLGPVLDSIFTPPWNRCSQDTVDSLKALGFQLLSRDMTAASLRLNGLQELAVNVDWSRQRKGVPITLQERGQFIAATAQKSEPVGVMLHHAVMDVEQHRALKQMLNLLANHDRVRCRTMVELSTKSSR